MNFIFVSPQFPKTYWNFCDRLKQRGVCVLGIGDTPYDELDDHVKASLVEYYRVDNMENYEEMFRAVAYFSFRYGKIDWIESNNEYWLAQDARLRSDFHITTGYQSEEVWEIRSKSRMKKYYAQAGIPTARWHMVTTQAEGEAFIEKVGYPVIVKPDTGVGAARTYRISDAQELSAFYAHQPSIPYIMEEFIPGVIISYDGIMNAGKEILFDTSHIFPTPIMDIVNTQDHLVYYSAKQIDPKLKALGQRAVEAFPGGSRFFHLEFFQLLEDKEGIGKKGDYVGLEVNMRPPGGYTTDMMNFANNADIYSIWADMITTDATDFVLPAQRPYVCIFASRRDQRNYVHTHEEILERYGAHIVMEERMPQALSDAMGNQMYTANFAQEADAFAFAAFVHERKGEDHEGTA